jgi:hypothetical protein
MILTLSRILFVKFSLHRVYLDELATKQPIPVYIALGEHYSALCGRTSNQIVTHFLLVLLTGAVGTILIAAKAVRDFGAPVP